MKLPKAESDAPEWQVAMETLILVAERDGPEMLARIAVMKALHRGEPPPAPKPRRTGEEVSASFDDTAAAQSRCGLSFAPALMGSSKRPRSAISVCAIISGIRRINRAAVSGTV
jgi:hypothetical protein